MFSFRGGLGDEDNVTKVETVVNGGSGLFPKSRSSGLDLGQLAVESLHRVRESLATGSGRDDGGDVLDLHDLDVAESQERREAHLLVVGFEERGVDGAEAHDDHRVTDLGTLRDALDRHRVFRLTENLEGPNLEAAETVHLAGVGLLLLRRGLLLGLGGGLLGNRFLGGLRLRLGLHLGLRGGLDLRRLDDGSGFGRGGGRFGFHLIVPSGVDGRIALSLVEGYAKDRGNVKGNPGKKPGWYNKGRNHAWEKSVEDIRILVLEGGFVFVCRCPDPSGYPFWLPYTNRRTIRRWGTSQGLSELANGPLSTTQLDAVLPEGQCPVRAIIDVMNVTESGAKKWAKELDQEETVGRKVRT